MNISFKGAAFALVLWAIAVPAFAQSLTTLFAHDNAYRGNTFDVTPSTNMTLDSFDVNVGVFSTSGGGAGAPVTVAIYWRSGTSDGFQDSAEGWSLLGRATVTSAGADNPTHIPVGGLTLTAGQTYGLYIDLENYGSGSDFLYTNGGPAAFSNSDLALTTFYGKGSPVFTGGTFVFRQWNGTVYYTKTTSCASEGYKGAQLTWCQNICENGLTGQVLDTWIHRWIRRYRDLPYCAVEQQQPGS